MLDVDNLSESMYNFFKVQSCTRKDRLLKGRMKRSREESVEELGLMDPCQQLYCKCHTIYPCDGLCVI